MTSSLSARSTGSPCIQYEWKALLIRAEIEFEERFVD